jgi:hypothetical protein
MPSEFHFATPVEFDANETEVVVFDQGGVVVTAFAVSHPPVDCVRLVQKEGLKLSFLDRTGLPSRVPDAVR